MNGVMRGWGDITRVNMLVDFSYEWSIPMDTIITESYDFEREVLSAIPVNIPEQGFEDWYVQVREVPTTRRVYTVSLGYGLIIPYPQWLHTANNFQYSGRFNAKNQLTSMNIYAQSAFIYADGCGVLNGKRYTNTFQGGWPLFESGSSILVSSLPCAWEDLATVGYTVP
jgi:hypothetical protein